MNVLDLFSGIGGFSLGLERAGHRTVAFCEIEPYCQAVIAKHWPGVPIYRDIRELTAERLRTDGIAIDAICGGFPCQDISIAGKGEGIKGSRSGLWSEYARLIGELRPHYAIVENVAALLNRGLERVLGDLAEIGYDAEWHCIPASAVGAPHRRDRLWILAYPKLSARIERHNINLQWGRPTETKQAWMGCGEMVYADCGRRRSGGGSASERRLPITFAGGQVWVEAPSLDDAVCGRCKPSEEEIFARRYSTIDASWWSSEPNVGRVVDGVPARVDRLAALGNAIVPQVAEIIGKALIGS